MNRHIFLNNTKTDNPKFNRQRNVGGGKKINQENDQEESNEPKIIKEFQKERFRNNNAIFYLKKKQRKENRTIQFPVFIELIKIKFYNTFNIELKKIFYSKYGLLPVELKDFNKTVCFEIVDEKQFENFKKHIEIIIKSDEGTSYQNQEYNILALVYEFEFIDSRTRLLTLIEGGVLLNLVSTISQGYIIQKESIFSFLNQKNYKYSYINSIPDLIEIQNIPRADMRFIADNFDIVFAITSSRVERIRPGYTGPIRDYTFSVDIPQSITTVGIIDSGIEKLEPLKNAILPESFDHTNTSAFWDSIGHGTLVAGLVILGNDFYKETKDNYFAKAKVLSIKAIQESNDSIDIPQLINDIKAAKKSYGIRIFNMSLIIPGAKKYNDTFSQFAYELDKLAYEEDVLIFISVGNFNDESLKALVEEFPHPNHEYPDFFYKLDRTTDKHNCEDTNICIPSESLNNISVGALASNLETDKDHSDVTPNMLYPAYYTRKFHYDYSQTINSQNIKAKNKHLNKPDFVFDGGDLFKEDAGIEILKPPAPRGLYFGKTCGTSLATPLITSLAAEILNNYPTLRTQTVKAILINSADFYSKNDLPHFKDKPDSLLKSLVGFGKPNIQNLTGSSDKSILYIIEDEIKIGEIISRPINLPTYLKESANKLQFDITLCYSFLPIKDNQLDYLPLYLSFNLTKNLPIEILANAKQDTYSIKQTISWSEDHFGIDNRLLSNAQSMSYRLQPFDYDLLNNSVAITLRSLAKNEFKEKLEKKAHQFSLAIRITEIIKNENENNLYNEMLAINNYIEIQSDIALDNIIENEL